MNFYEALDLSPTASSEEVEEAFRKAARKVHPDLNQKDPLPAEARMKLLNHIRETLTDPEKRAIYDAELAKNLDSARIETAIHETLKETRDKAILDKGLKRAIVLALVLGIFFGIGVWWVLHSKLAPPNQPAVSPTPPTPQANPAAKSPPPRREVSPKRTKPTAVVHFGSTTKEVLEIMGKPDFVEELPASQVRILHYGQLRLVFQNDKLVPGSGIQK